MALLSYGGLLLIMLALPALLAARFHWRLELTIGPACVAPILTLYILGLCGLLHLAVWVVCGLAAVCWLGALYFALRSVKAFLAAFARPALLLFLIFAPVCYLGNIERFTLFHDEFVHWQAAVKLMHEARALYGDASVSKYILYDYYPAAPLWETLFVQFLGLRDGAMYVGFQQIWFALLLGGMAGTSWQRPVRALLTGVLLFAVNMLFYPFTMLRLVVDPLIGVLVALLVYALFFPEEDRRLDLLRFGVLLCLLAMMKNGVTVLLAGLLLLARVALPRMRGRRLREGGMLAAAVLLCVVSWKVYVGLSGIRAFYPTVTGENLQALWQGTLNAAYLSVPKAFAQWMITPLPQSEIYTAYAIGTTPLILYGALLLFSVGLVAAWGKAYRRRALGYTGALWGLALVYLAGVVFAYTFSMQPWEAEILNDIARYVTTPMLWLGLGLAMALSRLAQARNLPAQGVGAAALVLSLVFGNNGHIKTTYVTRENLIWTRWQEEPRREVVGFLREHVPEGSRLRMIGDSGQKYYGWRYQLIPQWEILPYGGEWKDAPEAGDPGALQAALSDYDYVYIVNTASQDPNLAVDERYAQMFVQGIEDLQDRTLYQVIRQEGQPARLMPIATYTPSWEDAGH